MALTLAEIRARAKEAEERKANGNNGERKPDAFLAHWNIPDNEMLTLRFLPDGNPGSDYPWKERRMITLPFAGIKGGDQKPTRVIVPCNEMWSGVNSCPVLAEVRTWYAQKDPTMDALASKYWAKKSWIMQCMIVPGSATVQDDIAPENPIRRVVVNKEIYDRIYAIYMNPKVAHLPVDYVHGRDFNITKSKNGGGYADYGNSNYDFSERELSVEEYAAIEKYGLFDLNDYMPKQPNEEELQAIREMFEASVNGEQYDPARWSKYYRPAGVSAPQGSSNSTSTSTSGTVAAASVAPAAPVAQTLNPAMAALVKAQTQQAPAQTTVPTQTTDTASLIARLAAQRNAANAQ